MLQARKKRSRADVKTEEEMRSSWRERRAALDAEFEEHVTKNPFP